MDVGRMVLILIVFIAIVGVLSVLAIIAVVRYYENKYEDERFGGIPAHAIYDTTKIRDELKVFYLLGLAPIALYPVCLLASFMMSTGVKSQEWLMFVIGSAFLYPLVPIGCFAASVFAANKGHRRLAQAIAVAPLAFYASYFILAFIFEGF